MDSICIFEVGGFVNLEVDLLLLPLVAHHPLGNLLHVALLQLIDIYLQPLLLVLLVQTLNQLTLLLQGVGGSLDLGVEVCLLLSHLLFRPLKQLPLPRQRVLAWRHLVAHRCEGLQLLHCVALLLLVDPVAEVASVGG